MKKILIGSILILLMFVLIISFLYLVIISGAIFDLRPNPPKPEIVYGEFPISISIEVDGMIKEIKDTVICEFAGYENLGSAGTYRKWKSRLKSGNDRLILFSGKDDEISFEIGVSYGMPEYYMGDLTHYDREAYEESMLNDKYLGIVQWEDGIQTGELILKEDAWEKYKMRIIDIKYSQPIKNTFK